MNKPSYYPQIDSLRFMAISAVLISHWLPQHWVNHLQLGRIGVDLFFVISGFLITRILLRQRSGPQSLGQKLKTFYLRRSLRIFPLYYFVVLLTYFVNRGVFEEALWWNLFYGSNFFILGREAWVGTMSHFWSLSVEEHFYLFWPLLILLPLRRRMLSIIIAAILLGLGCRFFFYAFDYPSLYAIIFTFSCFDALAIGALLAYLYHVDYAYWQRRIAASSWLPLLALAGLCYCWYGYFYDAPFDDLFKLVLLRLFAGILSFFLIAKAIDSTAAIFNNRYLVAMGKWSYSMYLLHNFIPGMLLGVAFLEHPLARFVLHFVVLLVLSYLSWRFLEMPFNRLKHRFKY
ncbi:MAG: acyltransferase [Bacteroidota bacterium]